MSDGPIIRVKSKTLRVAFDPFLELDAYQDEALRTAGGRNDVVSMRIYSALGLAGETGEYVDRIKKEHFHAHEPDRKANAKELGDVLWYLAIAAHANGFRLSEVAKMNIEKLRARYPAGFDPERSRMRGET